ncbi:hypothetical protein BCV72DRAFT_332863 [Rhizopus microsporus var. microsporus]|uniref:Ndc10 domain-containing protein n=2 Tax=Rhizopus microsporus TaxID=58291 RepID=A0A2G4SNC9_RHIZD|nr:uncharacterized protein RHIMIDRAFT_293643 [Rhizopus microsporus ATCC 52813]ORE10580.1 hypothetical protein BCV72DRAFT_332863 [Rhizopus microsporus var. microsporus]PHZ10252.1 hypothetical protein RHIMIDRAFT_293643 [Rhizopus microsporus ATCC 52813]
MNNQMNNRLAVNDEGAQRMIDNNSAMHYSNQMIIAKNMTHRSVNTIKTYSAKEEWKLSYFLAEYVMKQGRKLRKNPDGASIALGRESALAYVKYIADMAFLDTLEKEKVKSSKQNFEDRGKNTLNDDYTKQDMEEFADLFSLVLEDQGISECIALVATITFGKTSQRGRIEYGSSVRHHDVEITHANRKSALNMIAQENISSDQQKMVSRWGTNRMVDCYILSLPVEAVKSLPVFPPHQGNRFCPVLLSFLPKICKYWYSSSCSSVKAGQNTHARDTLSAVAIGLSGMAIILLGTTFPQFNRNISPSQTD